MIVKALATITIATIPFEGSYSLKYAQKSLGYKKGLHTYYAKIGKEQWGEQWGEKKEKEWEVVKSIREPPIGRLEKYLYYVLGTYK